MCDFSCQEFNTAYSNLFRTFATNFPKIDFSSKIDVASKIENLNMSPSSKPFYYKTITIFSKTFFFKNTITPSW